MKQRGSANIMAVPLLSVAMLLALSLVDWATFSDGRLSSFNLFEDLLTEPMEKISVDLVDPFIAVALEEVTSEEELPVHELDVQNNQNTQIAEDVEKPMITNSVVVEKIDGVQPIEDFSPEGNGLSRLASALSESHERLVRIAVIGDSYIEGDILTQDIRKLLQTEYGGRGVGYMSMHSDFPGFRRSITQNDKGWSVVDMRNVPKDSVKTIAGDYCVSTGSATTTFRASKNGNGAWTRSTVVYFSPSDSGEVKLTTASGERTFKILPDNHIQYATVDGETDMLTVSTDMSGLKVLGAWLDGDTGVAVDCMSLRGNSGVTHRGISRQLAREMSPTVDYDLVVIEFGMNALSAEQTEYSSYSILMSSVVKRLRQCYPNADLLMLGVGDRGQKNGTLFESMPTVQALTKAQRDCARREGILFWDTMAAMGGVGSIVDWRERGLVNSDYVHLNHKGGAVLAQEFINALKLGLNQ